MEPTRWKCPYCGHAQIVTVNTFNQTDVRIRNDLSRHGKLGARIESIVCSNSDCKEITLSFSLHDVRDITNFDWSLRDFVYHSWSLLPESTAKPQPDYIPEPIVENYNQACRIRDLSANASAAMSRRCLQGMIRNFCAISKPALAREIDTLRVQVDEGKAPQGVSQDTMNAIDHVRHLGNIGAHMEKDINLILDVEPGEAQALINLIELLFEEWYVAKHVREARLMELGMVVEKKKEKKEQAALAAPPEKLPAPKTEGG